MAYINDSGTGGQVFSHGNNKNNNNSSSSIICLAPTGVPTCFASALSFGHFSEVAGQRVWVWRFFLSAFPLTWDWSAFRFCSFWFAFGMQHFGRGLGFWFGWVFLERMGKGWKDARVVEGTTTQTHNYWSVLIHGEHDIHDYHTLIFLGLRDLNAFLPSHPKTPWAFCSSRAIRHFYSTLRSILESFCSATYPYPSHTSIPCHFTVS